MALSGSFRQTFTNNGAHDLIIEWSATQNIAGNYSDVTAHLFLKGNYSWSTIQSAGVNKAVSITINGVRSPIKYTTVNISGTEKRKLMSHTQRVHHNSDGGKDFDIFGVLDIELSWWNGRPERSYAMSRRVFVLNSIPRVSTLSGVTSSLDYGQPLKFTINSADGSFRHTLKLSVAGFNGNILTEQTGGAKSYNTNKNWSSGLPNSTSNRATLSLLTYSGNTKIGQRDYGLTMTVPADVKPTISSITHSESNAKVKSVLGAVTEYVQGISNIAFNISSSSSYGATIKTTSIEVGGRTIIGTNLDLSTLSATSGASVPVNVKVTDSRGRTATKSTTIKINPYTAPKISSFTVQRVKGTDKLKINRSGSVSSIKIANVEKNTYSAKVQIMKNGTTNWVEKHSTGGAIGNIEIAGVDRAASFSVRLLIQDKFDTSISVASISTEKVLLNLHEDKGVGIGKMHERGALDVDGDSYIKGKLQVDKLASVDNIFANKNIETAATLKGNVLDVKSIASELIPAGANINNYTRVGFYYNPSNANVQKMSNRPDDVAFSLLVQRHAGIVQIWTTYETDNPRVYIRNQYNGRWGDWRMVAGIREEPISPQPNYKAYSSDPNNDNYPMIRRVGGTVSLSGAMHNLKAIGVGEWGNDSQHVLAKLPVWARPKRDYVLTQQGTANRIFQLKVDRYGTVTIARMRDGKDTLGIGVGNWLNLSCTYTVLG